MKLLLFILTSLLILPQYASANHSFVGNDSTTVLPQETTGVSAKIIRLLNHIDSPIEGSFYVSSITDDRAFNSNIGLAHRYLDRPLVVPLLLSKDFLKDLEQATQRWKPQMTGHRAIKMKIKEIYLWDYIHFQIERRYAKVVIEFMDREDESIGTFTSLITEKGKYIRFSHEKRLEKAIWDCLEQLAEYLKKGAKRNEYSKKAKREEGTVVFGAVNNFLDLKKQDLKFIRPVLEKANPPELYRYKPTNDRELKTGYYAYLTGEDIYIKATNYANSGAYYVKVLEKGKYWFMIDRVNIQSLSQDLFRESDQMLANVVIGIIIDSETGIPQFITDDLLKELIAPYPDLADKYLIVNILKYPVQLDRVRRLIAEINQRY